MRRIIVVCSLLAILIGRCPQRGRRISLPATSSDSCHCIRLAVVQCALLDDGPMDSGQANFSEGLRERSEWLLLVFLYLVEPVRWLLPVFLSFLLFLNLLPWHLSIFYHEMKGCGVKHLVGACNPNHVCFELSWIELCF